MDYLASKLIQKEAVLPRTADNPIGFDPKDPKETSFGPADESGVNRYDIGAGAIGGIVMGLLGLLATGNWRGATAGVMFGSMLTIIGRRLNWDQGMIAKNYDRWAPKLIDIGKDAYRSTTGQPTLAARNEAIAASGDTAKNVASGDVMKGSPLLRTAQMSIDKMKPADPGSIGPRSENKNVPTVPAPAAAPSTAVPPASPAKQPPAPKSEQSVRKELRLPVGLTIGDPLGTAKKSLNAARAAKPAAPSVIPASVPQQIPTNENKPAIPASEISQVTAPEVDMADTLNYTPRDENVKPASTGNPVPANLKNIVLGPTPTVDIEKAKQEAATGLSIGSKELLRGKTKLQMESEAKAREEDKRELEKPLAIEDAALKKEGSLTNYLYTKRPESTRKQFA